MTRRGEHGLQMSVFGKGSKTRTVLLEGKLAADVAEFTYKLTPEDSVFGVGRKQAWSIVRAAAERAGIDRGVSPHCCATHMPRTPLIGELRSPGEGNARARLADHDQPLCTRTAGRVEQEIPADLMYNVN